MPRSVSYPFVAASLLALTSSLSHAAPTAEQIKAAADAAAAYPDAPGLPKVKFDPERPIPAKGNVRDIESLTTAPEGMVMTRRNNFYRRTPDGKDLPGTGLYRWSFSGHISNYDEAKVGDFKNVPVLLKLRNGQPVTDAATWTNVRRKEVVDLVETYMFGRVPTTGLPRIEWSRKKTTNPDGSVTTVADGKYVNADGTPFVDPSPLATAGRGAASAEPTAPASAAPAGQRPVPQYTFNQQTGTYEVNGFTMAPAPAATPAPAPAPGATGRGGAGAGAGTTAPVQNGLRVTYTVPAGAKGAVPLIQGGDAAKVLAMGFGTVNFQGSAPNVSMGRPDDWGAIRKNAWAVSRSLDFLETDPTVDAHQVAVTGHSIGGKQALMRAIMDERIGFVFASCSGEGGASLMRRDFGETIDDIGQLSPGNYCANFTKFIGNWEALPVDSHMLIALMAPRPALVTGGTEDLWSDPVGVFWAAKFASPVYKLFGKTAIDADAPPAPNTFIGGDLMFYNHIGGHITTAEESAKYLELCQKYFHVRPLAAK